MENFDGFIGTIAVSGMRAGLDKDTTINLIASEDIGRVAAGVLRQHEKYMHKTLTLSSEAATMEQISESYKKATGRQIPAAPTLAGKALVKFNSALQNLVDDLKRTHHARTSGQMTGMESGIELAKSVCKLRTYYEWKSEVTDGTADKDWNKISLFKLMTGRSTFDALITSKLEMPSSVPSEALETIVSSEDLVHCVARYVPSRAALQSLCLVSKLFNQAFSQFLYSSIVFHDGNAHILRDPEELIKFTSNPNLIYCKSLVVKLIEGSWAIGNHREVGRLVDAPGYGRLGDIRHWAGRYNESIVKILSLTPNIYRFEWENWPISESVLEMLEEQCPSLRDVSIVYPNLSKFSRTERFYRDGRSTFNDEKPKMIPLPKPELQNLRKLYLYDISGDVNLWIPKIATMLGRSRFLEELGLSLSSECERQHALAGQSRAFLDFFPSLVQRYRDQGDEPLRLRVLKLGYGVLLNMPKGSLEDNDSDQGEYLSSFTHREYLEELYMDNDLDVGCPLKIRSSAGRIAWSWITPSFLPNLKRFTFTSLSVQSQGWLGQHPDPTFASGLAMGIGTEKLAFSYVDDSGALHSVRDNNIRRHIGQIGERTFFLHKYLNHPNLPLKSPVVSILKPCHKDLLCLGSCTWIRTLAICLQKQTMIWGWKKITQTLPQTEHLWVRIGMDYPLLDSRSEGNHRGNAVRMQDGALVEEQHFLHSFWRRKWAEMAAAMAEAKSCPTKYLKIGHMAWRVLPRPKGARKAVLEPLDRWEDEIEGPDVFRYNNPVRQDHPY
ncbi:hypothetical protein KVR01_010723 [Diaporthe batatas]|uniref:uncharacterized protein n=1 Tax=Diaporthe batatas TaxID=748121 RepID=UPI001D052A24|nr:uncharacterized protein KVR01_010723 [Diaporthe batatas]KAG8160086.1 hypothetical protein KVR01_010723 [Diaporthe batatas]